MAMSLRNDETGALTVPNAVAKPSAAAVPPGMKIGDDFPMVCEPCLGDNPYVRMIKSTLGRQCQISKRPFTSFTWRTTNGRRKDTIICYQVAAEKNICQCCLCDMDYGLPVGVRDAFLASLESSNGDGVSLIPTSEQNQANYYARKAALVAQGDDPTTGGASSAVNQAASQQLLNAVRGAIQSQHDLPMMTRYRQVNLPRLCNAWVNGKCSRVASGNCPFRPCCGAHAFPELVEDQMANSEITSLLREKGAVQAMKLLSPALRETLKRYMSNSNNSSNRKSNSVGPVRNKDIKQQNSRRNNVATKSTTDGSNQANSTLVLMGLLAGTTENDLRTVFDGYGEVIRFQILAAKRCAFVQFVEREAAQSAVNDLEGTCIVRGKPVKVSWATPKRKQGATTATAVAYKPPPAPVAAPAKALPLASESSNEPLPAAPKALKAFVRK